MTSMYCNSRKDFDMKKLITGILMLVMMLSMAGLAAVHNSGPTKGGICEM